jgi:adenylosuccinate lyase
MGTHKAKTNLWREKVMKALNLEYKIINNQIVYKGQLKGYNTLVDLLVTECEKLGIEISY